MEENGHAQSMLPAGKKWSLVWHDEFDGTELDRSKWDYRLCLMGKRFETWTDDGVVLDGNSNAVFQLIEKDGKYYSSQLQTGYNFMDAEREVYAEGSLHTWPIGKLKEHKFLHKYGYYECRCKMQEKPGWWSAFWLQSPIIGSTLDPAFSGVEVDIMEQFNRDGKIQHNNHWNGYGSQHVDSHPVTVSLKDTTDGYHVFGLEWTPEYYKYYVDGELTHTINGPISHTEQFILISTEPIGYRSPEWNAWEDLKTSVGDKWIVDYVRVFDEIKAGNSIRD